VRSRNLPKYIAINRKVSVIPFKKSEWRENTESLDYLSDTNSRILSVSFLSNTLMLDKTKNEKNNSSKELKDTSLENDQQNDSKDILRI
jgi:hypothetical protein